LQTAYPHLQVKVTPVTDCYVGINVAGPLSRELLSRVVQEQDLAPEAFGYMKVRQARIAGVADCVIWRIGFTGELSFELQVPAAYGRAVWDKLLEVGADLGAAPFGVEAQRILRLEKGHFIVGQDTDALTTAGALGMDWLIKLDKADFLGLPELRWEASRGAGTKLVALLPEATDFLPDEGGRILAGSSGPGAPIVGRVTSSRFSPTLQRSVCLGLIEAHLAQPGAVVEVLDRSGRPHSAQVQAHHAFVDPEGSRVRG